MATDDADRRAQAPTVYAGGASAGALTLPAAAAEPVASLPAPADDARYRTIATLGQGGMGSVALAFDPILGRHVARKVASDRGNDAWLLSEAQIGAQLEHPSIVPVHDAAIDESGRPSYVMRVVRGRTLREVLQQRATTGSPSLVELLAAFRQVCLAVDYAHEQGVVHRDLKPTNVIVGDFGEVYVLDWGVACVLPEAKVRVGTPLPSRGHLVGSLGYMAPEQARGDAVDARADVFALGVILHEILVGAAPFVEDSIEQVQRRGRAKHSVPPMPSAITLAEPFAALVRDCLRSDPARRPASARAIAEAIERHLDRERHEAERAREADELAGLADARWSSFESFTERAHALLVEAERRFRLLEPWASIEAKREVWSLRDQARALDASAAESLARAETAYAAALNHVAEHAPARRGLARLHYRQFCDAERTGEHARMARTLELARSFDDGELSIELSCTSELSVETTESTAEISIARYERAGPLLVLGPPRALGRGRAPVMELESGSYRVSVQAGERTIHLPVDLRRGQRVTLDVRIRPSGDVPADMLLVPGSPFLATLGGSELVPATLPDFAIARFPVTLREYSEFLDSSSPEELERRLPRVAEGSAPLLERGETGWVRAPHARERAEHPLDDELELPAHGLSWEAAAGYARWLARVSGRPYRLPTALEWKKAMRGADGRACPMGLELDYAFAKLRHSRPGVSELEPVGAFALDESPYGVRDMAGSVAEWTQTFTDGGAPPASDGQPPRTVVRLGCHWGSTREWQPAQYLSNSHVGCMYAAGVRLALELEGPSTNATVEPMQRARS